MADEETAELESLLDDRVPTLGIRVRDLATPRSSPASKGARLAWTHALRGLQSAIDHLAAWRALSRHRPRPVMAHYSLLRAAIDGAARCRWLVDPKVDPTTRAGRGYLAELRDIEAVRIIDDLDPLLKVPAGEPGNLDELERVLREEADAERVTIPPHSEIRPHGLATTYAGYKSLYKGPGTHLYAVLSAATHGHVWAGHLTRGAVLRQEGQPDTKIRFMDADRATWATRKVIGVLELAINEAEAHAASGEAGELTRP